MEDLMNKFLHFEEKNNLLTDKVEGFSYWPYVRFSIYMKLEEIRNDQHKEQVHKKITLRNCVDIIKNCTFGNPFLYKKHKDVLIISHARRSKIDGKYRCIYTDKIAECLGEHAVSAEFMYGYGHYKPAYTRHLLNLDLIDLLPAVQFPFFKAFEKETVKKIYSVADKITGLIAENFQIQFDYDYMRSMLLRRYYWHLKKKKLLKKLLCNITPKVIVEVVGYETDKLIINELASELGIETVELQHGVIGRGHLAYNYLIDREYDFLPKSICFFSDYWCKTCHFPVKNKIITGFPYIEEQKERYPSVVDKGMTIRVLILSQPEFSEKLINFTEQMLYLLGNENYRFVFLYKLHPAEYGVQGGKWNELRKYSNVFLIDSSDIPLYSLFAEADIQIGVTSTAIYEGLAYNLQTYICHFEKTDTYMGDLCKMGYAQMIEEAVEMVEKLKNFYRKPEEKKDPNIFFVENSLNHIMEKIYEECK